MGDGQGPGHVGDWRHYCLEGGEEGNTRHGRLGCRLLTHGAGVLVDLALLHACRRGRPERRTCRRDAPIGSGDAGRVAGQGKTTEDRGWPEVPEGAVPYSAKRQSVAGMPYRDWGKLGTGAKVGIFSGCEGKGAERGTWAGRAPAGEQLRPGGRPSDSAIQCRTVIGRSAGPRGAGQPGMRSPSESGMCAFHTHTDGCSDWNARAGRGRRATEGEIEATSAALEASPPDRVRQAMTRRRYQWAPLDGHNLLRGPSAGLSGLRDGGCMACAPTVVETRREGR
ncbi:hypothetical protein CALCODRAFT_335412 [Calocera cornea HHB12733]|uniref:Uncharacterized protein n=1 Tax=Calocera cornea HHB12733 TaxID=1353952 RepID=A0A165F0C7_9BASI|nr:hypothetical protein CALCODRAFT_335412 [Calocera cornea HHB12733]